MSRIPVAMVACLLAVAATAAQEIPATIEDCDERVRASPDDHAAYACFTDLVQMTGADPLVARSRLEGFVATRPADPTPRLALARLLRFRDGARTRALILEAVALAERSGDPLLIARAQLNLAGDLEIRGERNEAESAYGIACEQAERAVDPGLIAACTIGRARFFGFNSDELARGWQLISGLESRPWYDELAPRMRAHHLGSAATIAARLGRYRDAYRMARKALELTAAASLDKQHASAQSMIVAYAATLADIDRVEARRFAEASIAYYREAGMLSNELGVRFDYSRWAEEDEALRQLEIVERESRTNPFCRPLTRMALRGRGQRLLETRPQRALEAFRQALSEAEANGGLQQIATSRADLALASLRVDPHELDPAWQALDAIEALADRQGDERWNMELFSRRSPFYYAVIDHLIGLGDTQRAEQVLQRMRARRLRDHLRRSGVHDPLARDGRPDTLDAQSALLSFAIAPDSETDSWLIVRTRDRLDAYPVVAVDLDVRVDFWRSQIAARSPEEPVAAARLYRDLLGEALEQLDEQVTRLVVLPDGVLHRMAFGALREAPTAQPLVMRYEIVVTPSARIAEPRGSSTAGARAAVLADPYPDEAPEIPAAWRDLGERAADLGSLPFARREARDAVGALGRRAQLRLGAEATEGWLKGAVADRVSIIHLAVHAVVDEERPERSALILAASPGEDGMLQPREIAALPMTDVVVVLSACRSAGGRILAGEGAVSLARAFLEAGAPTVVAALSDLRDEEAARLMKRFYRQLATGKSVGEAMTLAKREAIGAGDPVASWSDLVVLGDPDIRPWKDAGSQSRIGTLGVVLLGLILLVVLIRGLPSLLRSGR